MNQNNEGNGLLEEIWEARKQIENENGNDIDSIYEKFHTKQLQHPADYFSGKPVVVQTLKAA
jgi:hypothetical protein